MKLIRAISKREREEGKQKREKRKIRSGSQSDFQGVFITLSRAASLKLRFSSTSLTNGPSSFHPRCVPRRMARVSLLSFHSVQRDFVLAIYTHRTIPFAHPRGNNLDTVDRYVSRKRRIKKIYRSKREALAALFGEFIAAPRFRGWRTQEIVSRSLSPGWIERLNHFCPTSKHLRIFYLYLEKKLNPPEGTFIPVIKN